MANVAAEQVAQPFSFPQPGRHRVEARLQQSQLGRVENGYGHLEFAALHPLHAVPDFVDRIGDG